jgi:hypothetical protein
MLRTNENFKVDIIKVGTLHEKVGAVEYQMSAAAADEILRSRKGTDKNMRPRDYLVKYINEEAGLLRKCTKVTIN